MAIHTMSTKCQYRPQISTLSESCGPSLPRKARTHSERSQMTPPVTWAPGKPVSTKKVVPKRLVCRVRPRWTKCVNSKHWKPTKPEPNSAVMKSQTLAHFMSLRWTAAGAVDALALVGEVGADERAEEHALGAEEGPHPELPMVEPGDADVRVVVRG